jgi:phosphatidylserine/phosphatidylglycerophosphate/cardiolipin synthase-like enzyme
VQVITRFNLTDFANGVSDISALRSLLDAGATVRGVRNLHAKLYLFGTNRVIITSANLMIAALDRNHEFGIVAEDNAVIAACQTYSDDLWRRGGKDLSRNQIDAWDKTVTHHRALGGRSNKPAGGGGPDCAHGRAAAQTSTG